MIRKFLITVLFIHIFTAVCFAGSIKDYEENQAKNNKRYADFIEKKITNNIYDVSFDCIYLNEFIRRVDRIKRTSNQQERESYLKDLNEELTRNVNKLNKVKEHIKDFELSDELKEYQPMQNVPDLLRTYINELTLAQTKMLGFTYGNLVNVSDIRNHEIEAFKAIETLRVSLSEMRNKHKLDFNTWTTLTSGVSYLQKSLENRESRMH